jgi:hypothetical protein
MCSRKITFKMINLLFICLKMRIGIEIARSRDQVIKSQWTVPKI